MGLWGRVVVVVASADFDSRLAVDRLADAWISRAFRLRCEERRRFSWGDGEEV